MVSQHLLDIIMLIEVLLLALAVSVYFVHGLWLKITARRTQKLSQTARESLARLVLRGHVNLEDIELLKLLPDDVQTMAFLEISRTLSGTGKERLRFEGKYTKFSDLAEEDRLPELRS